MNYIKINGLTSQYIGGLIIQSLPPITKPLLRTSIEQIDGRDGDIVTELGYSAYDKKLTIGLYGNYDIDRVIGFFTQRGQIIFSNEPDKYYNFTLLNQIDFERLVRFKTAEVTLHVQPFKYSAVDGTILLQNASAPYKIINAGNTYARPTLHIEGTGIITLALNGNSLLSINMPTGGITIDTEQMEAYNDNGLQNRRVTGDYSLYRLNQGANTVSWDGNLTSFKIEKYSRWL